MRVDTKKWLRHGVPKGSIIVPLFFLLYINDLPKIVNGNTEVVLYTDHEAIVLRLKIF
jgi:hypothetical protein